MDWSAVGPELIKASPFAFITLCVIFFVYRSYKLSLNKLTENFNKSIEVIKETQLEAVQEARKTAKMCLNIEDVKKPQKKGH